MATRKKNPDEHESYLAGEADLTRRYRTGPQDEPPAELDKKILAAAKHVIDTSKTGTKFGARWVMPLSAAAVMVLSLGVLLRMLEPAGLNETDSASAPAPLEASPPTLARNRPARTSARPHDQVPSAPPVSTPGDIAERVTAMPAAPLTDVSAAKTKSDVQPPMTSVRDERRTDSSKLAVMDEMKSAQGKLKKETQVVAAKADVVAVQVTGKPGAYTFNITLRSPDTGCQQYADWWEVVSEDGKLLARRILLHSHVDEQPFTRSSGPVPIQPATVVWVRAHMNTGGYGGTAYKGSVQTGFVPAMPAPSFAAQLATQAPLPAGCEF